MTPQRSSVETGEETLSGIEIFRQMPPADVAALGRRCRWRRYRAHQQIVGYLDDTKDVFFLVHGKARIVIHAASGREVCLGYLNAGQVFGELSALDGHPRSATVVVLSDALVASLPAPVFRDVVRRHGCVADALLRRLTRVVRMLSERVHEFSALPVPARIQAELLRLAREHGGEGNRAVIRPAPTHAEIASRVSTHREAVTRELSDLARGGLIERRSGDLIVCDVAALAALVEEARGN
jgi:CRP-like cAMP-binding protein